MSSISRSRSKLGMALLGLLLLLAPLAYVAWLLMSDSVDPSYEDLVLHNYLIFFGMPYAAFLSYYLVLVLESGRGPIEVDFVGMKFRGAAGPLIFWLLIFLAIQLGFKLFWVGVP